MTFEEQLDDFVAKQPRGNDGSGKLGSWGARYYPMGWVTISAAPTEIALRILARRRRGPFKSYSRYAYTDHGPVKYFNWREHRRSEMENARVGR